MVLDYLGIILFLLVGNKVEFIVDGPVRRAERAQKSDRCGIPYQCVPSRHPE